MGLTREPLSPADGPLIPQKETEIEKISNEIVSTFDLILIRYFGYMDVGDN